MTLAACASASKPRPAPEAPAPIIQRVFETRLVCPAELALPVPPEAAPGPGAIVRTNDAGDAYLAAKDAREDLLAGRLLDAQAQCPPVSAAPMSSAR